MRGGEAVSTQPCPVCASVIPVAARTCPICGATLTGASGADGASPADMDALRPGTRLDGGNFSLGKVLGRGGFGITYLGADLRRGHPVALKEFFPAGANRQGLTVVPPTTLDGGDFQAALGRFLEEGQILARFTHPAIVDVYGVFRENATAYMAMEYLRGKTLAGRLEGHGKPLPEAELLAITQALVDALEAIHREGLLHRDIKPENVILAEREGGTQPVLIDFGATREFAGNKTLRQSVVLTPGYAPLEQYAQQARRGPFTDIYALAATLYHLATGEQPPAATDRAMGVALKPPRQLNPVLSPAFERALMHGLEIAVDRRPQTVREFYRALAGLPPAPSVSAPDARPAPPRPPAPPPPAPRIDAPPPPPPALPGHLGRVRQIALILQGSGAVRPGGDAITCPMCRSAAMLDPTTATGPVPCAVCRAADLQERVPVAARDLCPSCGTDTPELVQIEQLAPGALLRCPACRTGAVVQYARPGGLLPDLWARCDTCAADFDYHLQGDRLTLEALPNGPGQLDPALRGQTLPRAEWQRRSGRTATLYLCPHCAAEIDVHPDDGSGRRLEWVAVNGSLDAVPTAYRGRRSTALELSKHATGLAPEDGTHECPNCRAQFDQGTPDELTLLRAPHDPHGLVARARGRAFPIAFWRAIAAGKRDPARPGLVCPVCTGELAALPDGDFRLIAYDPSRDPYGVGKRYGGDTGSGGGTPLAREEWQRIAAGVPPADEEQRLREEAVQELWRALLAGEVSLTDAADSYPDPPIGDELVVLALPAARYRRTWISYHDIDLGTLWVTTRQLRYHGDRGDATIPLTAVREWTTERWEERSVKEEDVVVVHRSDTDETSAFGFHAADQLLEVTVESLTLGLRIDAARFVALCQAFQQRL